MFEVQINLTCIISKMHYVNDCIHEGHNNLTCSHFQKKIQKFLRTCLIDGKLKLDEMKSCDGQRVGILYKTLYYAHFELFTFSCYANDFISPSAHVGIACLRFFVL